MPVAHNAEPPASRRLLAAATGVYISIVGPPLGPP